MEMSESTGGGAAGKGLLRVLILLLIAALAVVLVMVRPWEEGRRREGPPGPDDKESPALKIAFFSGGSVGDLGFSYQHNLGRLGLEAALGARVRTFLAENLTEPIQVEDAMRSMCGGGTRLIFSTFHEHAVVCLKVAKQYPDVKFMQFLAAEPGEPAPLANVSTYGLRDWEPAYVCGAVAAMACPDGAPLGFIGPAGIGPTMWVASAFTLGARSVNPDVTVDLAYIGGWHDPPAEMEAVRRLAAQGVKAIYILTICPVAAMGTAESVGVRVLTHFSDLSGYAPSMWITGSIWRWFGLYRDTTTQVLAGKWTSLHHSGGLREGCAAVGPMGPEVAGSVIERAREIVKRIASEELQIFAGPLHDLEGNLKVPEGRVLTPREVRSVDWFVRGIRLQTGAPDPGAKKAERP